MSPAWPRRATCCIAGCGPAGAVLGLLLARAGVDVLVLEKHADFLRDFRGDTVHPSTLRLLDELGLGEGVDALPGRSTAQITVVTDEGAFGAADFRRLRGSRREIRMLPQWDLLEFLTTAAADCPSFRLVRSAEVVGLLERGRRVRGLRYRAADGALVDVEADLVVAADGRTSSVRAAAGLRVRDFGSPIDVLWFRLPRRPNDVPSSSFGRVGRGRFLAFIDRGDYWQVACVVPRDEARSVREGDLATFRGLLVEAVPWVADRVAGLGSWDDVSVLTVRVDRLRRWWRPGLLCIGDAAHAMSPVGGVGINLAVQDAVAAAALLAAPLRQGRLRWWHLARVQVRRWPPTALTQLAQRAVQRRIVAPIVTGRVAVGAPLPLRLLRRVPALQAVPAYLIGVGIRPEHAPDWARPGAPVRDGARAPAPVATGSTTGAPGGPAEVSRPRGPAAPGQ